MVGAVSTPRLPCLSEVSRSSAWSDVRESVSAHSYFAALYLLAEGYEGHPRSNPRENLSLAKSGYPLSKRSPSKRMSTSSVISCCSRIFRRASSGAKAIFWMQLE